MTARLKSVDPRTIRVPETRVTSSFDSETIEMFKQSIKDLGILEPPVCMEDGEEIYVVDGLHRIIEAMNSGQKRIQVVVMPGDLREALLKNLALNNLRGKIKPTEVMNCVKSLYEDHHMGTDEIAKQTGFSRPYVERLIIISRAIPLVLEALDEGLIALGHAELLAKVEPAERQQIVLGQCIHYRLTVDRLKQFIADVATELEQRVEAPPPPPPAGPPMARCAYCGEELDVTALSNPTTCISCFGTLAGAMAKARAEAARAEASPSE